MPAAMNRQESMCKRTHFANADGVGSRITGARYSTGKSAVNLRSRTTGC
jgi:hypothetical protein